MVDGHLDACERCRMLAAELRDVNHGLRAVIAPLVLGAGVLSYLAINVDAPEFADFAWMYAAATGIRLASRPIRSVSQVVGIASVALVILIVALTLAH
jgi:hypothetical protein